MSWARIPLSAVQFMPMTLQHVRFMASVVLQTRNNQISLRSNLLYQCFLGSASVFWGVHTVRKCFLGCAYGAQVFFWVHAPCASFFWGAPTVHKCFMGCAHGGQVFLGCAHGGQVFLGVRARCRSVFWGVRTVRKCFFWVRARCASFFGVRKCFLGCAHRA